ncbi:unnamed protein product [Urochloa humidicola]
MSQHLWGPLIIISLQQFCHMHGRPGASQAIRDSEFRKTGPEKEPSGEQNKSRETGCQVDPRVQGKPEEQSLFHLQ